MEYYSDLSISGLGYLQEIVPFNNEILARIYCLSSSEINGKQEAIILNCLVKNSVLKAKLVPYGRYFERGSSILVKFIIQYFETTDFQNCMTHEDPDHIINISAKLVAIDKVFVDGVRFVEEQKQT